MRTISRTGSGSSPAAGRGIGTSVMTPAIVAAGIGLMGIAGLSGIAGLAGLAGLASSTAAAQADTPEQVFALGGGMLAGSLDTADASQLGATMAVVLDDSSTSTLPAGNDDLMVEITATDIDVMLTQSLESGPVIKARVEGRPLVPTRESVATTELYLDRINGEVTVNWTDNRVRDHKLPGAIRAVKVQLRNEKIFTGSCQPVAQRAF